MLFLLLYADKLSLLKFYSISTPLSMEKNGQECFTTSSILKHECSYGFSYKFLKKPQTNRSLSWLESRSFNMIHYSFDN